MGSIRTGEFNCKIYSQDCESQMKNKGENEENGSPPNCRQSSQTPEYVKRTAKLFESVNVSEEIEIKNGLEKRTILESFTLAQGEPKEKSDDSADVLDGESNKKPSYLGVSCSNSGYRNVINYDSKLREGFHSAHSQRESLVLCSSRLRENSPLRRDVEFKFRNGAGPNGDTIKVNANEHFEREQIVPVNGVSQMKKFVNISTSTKTISTFRNSKDVKINELEDNFRHDKNNECNSNGEPNLISKPILNGKNESGQGRRGYSGLGPDFSPKILKSPEKNCNSFLKSISSFENNCKKSQPAKNPSYSRGEQTICDTATSIQQRIERLYGPGALAQGFRMQKSNSKTKILDKHTGEDSSEGNVESVPKVRNIPISLNNVRHSDPIPDSSLPKATPTQEIATTEPFSADVASAESETVESQDEKNGLYFLKLLKKETDRLEDLASFAESELENGENLPEEINGKLRAAAGKARLLVCQKLHQFEGLCQKNMNEKPSEPFPTTSEDLAGFWDMVMLQVVQVYGVFEELEELKKNNWKAASEETSSPTTNGQTQPIKITPKKSTPTSSVAGKSSQKSEAAKKAREETRRKMLEERRKKMKELKESKIVNNDTEVEIFAK